MKIDCPSCRKQFHLDDSKVPPRPFAARCPVCGGKIAVTPPAEAPAEACGPKAGDAAPVPGTQLWEKMKRDVTAEILKNLGVQVHKSEQELREEAGKGALVCEADAGIRERIGAALLRMGYRVEPARTTEEALRKIEADRFDLITVDQRFPDDPDGGGKILQRIGGLPSLYRRKMILACISENAATLDVNSAFILGANVTVAKKDLPRLEKILSHVLSEHDRLYRNFFLMDEEVKSLEVQGLTRKTIR